jgi:hypothetical protein
MLVQLLQDVFFSLSLELELVLVHMETLMQDQHELVVRRRDEGPLLQPIRGELSGPVGQHAADPASH